MKSLLIIAAGVSLATGVQGADLLQLYRDAQAYDTTLGSARATYKAGLERVPQARAGLGPQANLSASATLNSVYRKSFGTSTGSNAAYTLALSQPLYRKQNNILLDEAKTQIGQFDAQLASAEQDLILRVAQAYFDVLQAQDNVAVSKSQKKAIEEQLAQAKRNFEVGTSTITDTHEAQARYDLATAKEISDANDLEVKRHALEILIGKMPEPLASLKEKVELPLPQPNDMAQWVGAAEARNLQVVIAGIAETISGQEIERNRAAFTPTVDLIASLSDSGNGASAQVPIGGEPRIAQMGVQLAIPLWDSGLRNSRIRESVANRDKARQDLETTRRTVAQSARQAFLGVTSGIAQVKALQQALVSSQSSLDSTKLGQEVGVRTGVDVLNAQQQLFQAKRDLLQARYTTILNQLRLKSAAGTLSETDLLEINVNLTSR